MKKIYIYGASGHGRVVADIALACGFESIVFVDDGTNLYPNFDAITNDAPIALAIGENKTRKKVYEKLLACGFEIATLIHPKALISRSATLDVGTVVMANAVVNPHAKIGCGVILNTACVIEHDCVIEDFTHISPSVCLAGDVHVKELSHVGIGSCAIQGVVIGRESLIGAGSVVLKDIEDEKVAYGNPCRVMRSRDA
jgi:UDP-N-acetylbacillosamine N-acetyltransferase